MIACPPLASCVDVARLPGAVDVCGPAAAALHVRDVARAAAVDLEGYPWVGMWNTKKIHRLDPDTGAVVQSHESSGRPYGIAIAADGLI